jgi:ankyrin repeat protein
MSISALNRAIIDGDTDLVDRILDAAGARAHSLLTNTSWFGKYGGYTPLMIACAEGNQPIVTRILFEDPGLAAVRISSGLTPLIVATIGGYPEIIKLLVRAIDGNDAALNSKRTPDGATALIIACQQANATLVKAFFHTGVTSPNPNIGDHLGNTPLIYAAAQRGRNDIMEKLIQVGANVNARNKMDRTALMAACIAGSTSSVELLLRRGAALNVSRKPDGATALLLAIHHNNREAAAKLIESGANVNTGTSHTNYTPLMAACEKGTLDLVKKLMSKGANVNARKNDDGFTPLIYASKRDSGTGSTEIVNILIKYNAHVNATTNGYRSTALMWASFKGNEGAVASLLQNKANPEIKTTNGKTALTFATLGRNARIANMLTKVKKEKEEKKGVTRRADRGKKSLDDDILRALLKRI